MEHLLVRPRLNSLVRTLLQRNGTHLCVALCLCALSLSAAAQTPASTTTNLALTSGTTSVTSLAIGAPITLTASVTAGATPIKTGQVAFCDAAPHCTDIHRYGIAQLTSAGTATLTLRPSVGSYQYKAIFLGTTTNATSSSTTAALSVTGIYPTVTAIAQTGSPGDYTLTAIVASSAKALPGPTGTVSFVDTNNSNTVVATANLTNPALSPLLVNSNNPSIDNEPTNAISGDFNNDGYLDVAAAVGDPSQPLAILLGDGKGDFTRVNNTLTTSYGVPTLVQDFNGDGIPDLLMTAADEGTITVLLSNGDGTFRVAAGSPFVSSYGNGPAVAADFNGDGIPDLVFGGGYYLTVWLGNGDGTFTQQPINSSSIVIDGSAEAFAAGDFNGDGIADLAVLNNAPSVGTEVLIYLGNGDGTFRLGSNTLVSTAEISELPTTLSVADFNADGNLDVVAPSYLLGGLAVLLGKGDGTFQTPTQIAAEGLTNNVAVGDFNGDGISDIVALADSNGTNFEVFAGNGDGTFNLTPMESASLPGFYEVVDDFNGDRITDLFCSGFQDTGAAMYFGELIQSTATATAVSPIGPGVHLVDVTYLGDTNFGPSTSTLINLEGQAPTPVITPAGGTYSASQTVSIEAGTGTNIFYTTNGSTPTTSSAVYVGPITVSTSETIKAIAAGFELVNSPVATAVYAIVIPPHLTSISPAFAASSSALTLTLNGTGFVSASTVNFGSTALATQFVSATQLTATLTAAQTATPGIVTVTVQNPAASGGASNALQFEIDTAGSATPPSFPTSSATVAAGASATYAVTLPSTATNVTVACLNLPAGAACTYSATPSTLTITTTSATPAGTYAITAVFTETLPGAAPAFLAFPLLLLPFAGLARKRSGPARKRVHPGVIWMLCLGIALTLGAVAGCGGSGSGGNSTPQTHQVTSSGTVTLVVQ